MGISSDKESKGHETTTSGIIKAGAGLLTIADKIEPVLFKAGRGSRE